jgi:uncharacterized membrane protein YdjX (TVP38/TMEM64 family)
MSTGKLIRTAVVILIAIVAVFVTIRYNAPALLRDLLAWIDAQGVAGILVFIATYIVATVLFIPGSILTLGAGFVFGVVGGTLSVSVASTLGASAAFLVGRYVARGWVAAKTSGSPRFAAIDEAVGREGWKIVLLTRLSPIFPFNLLNYAYGLTGVSLPAYFFASWIGMLPGTVMYVYFGSLAANLATLGGATEQRGGVQWLLYGLGLVATVAVTVFVTRLARRALRETLPEDGADLEGAS